MSRSVNTTFASEITFCFILYTQIKRNGLTKTSVYGFTVLDTRSLDCLEFRKSEMLNSMIKLQELTNKSLL